MRSAAAGGLLAARPPIDVAPRSPSSPMEDDAMIEPALH